MKILFFSHDGDLYGASRSLVNLASGLQAIGHTCHVILPGKGKLEHLLAKHKIEYSVFPYGWWMGKKTRENEEHTDQNLHRLTAWLKIRSNQWKAILKPMFSLQMKKLIKSADLIVSNSSVILTGFIIARRFGKPHIWIFREFGEMDFNLQPFTGEIITGLIYRKSGRIVFTSSVLCNYISGKYHLSPENYTVIRNGLYLESEYFQLKSMKKRHPVTHKNYIFSIIGAICPSKGHMDALEAFCTLKEEFDEIRLWIVGNGEDDVLHRFVSTRHLENHVSFFGYMEDMNTIYLETDCLLNCARWEAFGRTTVEALAYGIPVIGYNHAGTREILSHVSAELLYDNKEVLLADCMRRVITMPGEMLELAEKGWESAVNHFTIERYAREFDAFICS